jgi:hypothetical protein
MFRAILVNVIFIATFFASTDALACDDKPCETAYLAETKQYISNHVRRAETYMAERHAHSKNRERRAYALYQHIHMILFGKIPESVTSLRHKTQTLD